jgi:hypothetical protein
MSLWWLAATPFILLGLGVLWLRWQGRGWPSTQEKDTGTYANHFVYVDEDGTARELTADERDYLNTKFDPFDSGRPYIKYSYKQLTPDGKISGFLLKSSLPRGFNIAPDRNDT